MGPRARLGPDWRAGASRRHQSDGQSDGVCEAGRLRAGLGRCYRHPPVAGVLQSDSPPRSPRGWWLIALLSSTACYTSVGVESTEDSTGGTMSGSGMPSDSGGCEGALGCPCGPAGGCDPGLMCSAGSCVNIGSECGNGEIENDEQCDLGPQLDDEGSCKTDCTLAYCGDGFAGPGEGCDDGNLIDHDGCTNACRLPTCGDGTLQDGESCDDGNLIDSDACPGSCAPADCGDGFLWEGRETCDDGNNSSADGCTNACLPASCGDGFRWSGMEECDGDALGGEDCMTMGFDAGTLGCTERCTYNTSGCTNNPSSTGGGTGGSSGTS